MRAIASSVQGIFHRKPKETEQIGVAPQSLAFSKIHPLELKKFLSETILIGLKKEALPEAFDPHKLVPEAQRDILGERGVSEISVNKTPLIKLVKHTTGESSLDFSGFFVAYKKPGIEPGSEKLVLNSNVSIRKTSFTNQDGLVVEIVSCRNYHLHPEATEVFINGYPLENGSDTAAFAKFFENRDNLKNALANALSMRILNEMLPVGAAYDIGQTLFLDMQKYNPEASAVFLQRTQLIQQRLGNALADALGLSINQHLPQGQTGLIKVENDSYSITTSNPFVKVGAPVPDVASQEFTHLLREAEINISLSAEVYIGLIDQCTGWAAPYQKVGTAKYSCSIDHEGFPHITDVTLNSDDSSRTTG